MCPGKQNRPRGPLVAFPPVPTPPQVLVGYYQLPSSVDEPLVLVINPKGARARAVQRVWNRWVRMSEREILGAGGAWVEAAGMGCRTPVLLSGRRRRRRGPGAAHSLYQAVGGPRAAAAAAASGGAELWVCPRV